MTASGLPMISVVTITLNASAHLRRTIESVISQNYPKTEYIIVDGGSRDDTIEIVKSYGERVTKWISEPDRGIADAFNKGIKMSSGDMVGLINADDYYYPSAFEALAHKMDESPGFDVYFGKTVHQSMDGLNEFVYPHDSDLETRMWKQMPVSHPACFVARSAYLRFGNYRVKYRFAMDYELILRMYLMGARFCFINEVLAHFKYGRDCGWGPLSEVRDIAMEYGLRRTTAAYYYWTGRAMALPGVRKLKDLMRGRGKKEGVIQEKFGGPCP